MDSYMWTHEGWPTSKDSHASTLCRHQIPCKRNCYEWWSLKMVEREIQGISFYQHDSMHSWNLLWDKCLLERPNYFWCAVTSIKNYICVHLNILSIYNVLYIDLRPGQICHSKVMHWNEVTHSDGNFEKKSRRRTWLTILDKVKSHVQSKTDAPEESDQWTVWQLFPLDDDQTCHSKDIEWASKLLYNSVTQEVSELEIRWVRDKMW